ncbi:MAG: helicase C-terminal domain-containing protein, partial [Desulfoferrobacter sp.]
PFEVPEDPLVAARMDYFSEKGVNPFFNYQVPRAVINLKQGVGRLIRSSKDRGVVVIFDTRLFTKGYGRIFLESLPPCRITRDTNNIQDFLSIH